MKLKRNLVNALIEPLISGDNPNPDYVEQSVRENAIADRIADAVKDSCHEHSDDYRAVVQGLFEGGFLSTEEHDFSFDQLISYAVGIKMYYALDAFNELFDMLVAGGFNDPRDKDTQYNPCGDNYYSAMSFIQKPDDTEMQVARKRPNDDSDDDAIRKDWEEKAITRKVIFIENQSPSWCYVLESSMFGGEPSKLFILRLKKDYDSPCKLQEVIDREAAFNYYDFNWACYSSNEARMIATLDISSMECEGWWNIKRIEHTLFNIYSGRDALQEESKDG